MITKCAPQESTAAQDIECTSFVTPYFKKYTIVIMGTLNDMDATRAYVEFDVTIGPDCDNDAVSFTANVNDQFSGTYTLGINQAYPLDLSP